MLLLYIFIIIILITTLQEAPLQQSEVFSPVPITVEGKSKLVVTHLSVDELAGAVLEGLECQLGGVDSGGVTHQPVLQGKGDVRPGHLHLPGIHTTHN